MLMGDRIKEKRIEKGLTMEQLADKLGVGKSAVNKWEKGHVENIKRSTIEQLAQILGCTPAYLFGWKETETGTDHSSPFTVEEMQILEIFRSLPPFKQKEMLSYGKFMKEMIKHQKNIPS